MRRRFRYDRASRKMVEIGASKKEKAPNVGPFVWTDSDAYQSPVTGNWIEGRAARREDLRRHGCVDAREFGWGRRD